MWDPLVNEKVLHLTLITPTAIAMVHHLITSITTRTTLTQIVDQILRNLKGTHPIIFHIRIISRIHSIDQGPILMRHLKTLTPCSLRIHQITTMVQAHRSIAMRRLTPQPLRILMALQILYQLTKAHRLAIRIIHLPSTISKDSRGILDSTHQTMLNSTMDTLNKDR